MLIIKDCTNSNAYRRKGITSMLFRGKRSIVKNITRKNRQADKLIQKGKFNRALNLMHDALEVIENKIGTSNIAAAKQHLRLARFRIKEAKRAQYEMSLQICNAEVDRQKLSQSYTGRLVLRKLSKKNNLKNATITCSELFGLLHFAESVYHAEKAFGVLQHTSKPEPDLLKSVTFLLGKLYEFFDVPRKIVRSSQNAPPFVRMMDPNSFRRSAGAKTKKGRIFHPAFVVRPESRESESASVNQ